MSYFNLNKEMVEKSNLIIKSIDWIEEQIENKMFLFEEAISNNKHKEADSVELQILSLLEKLTKEESEMDNFLIKYKNLIEEERKLIQNKGNGI